MSAGNEQQADRYLLVLSILLGISVLKLTEVLELGGTFKAILAEASLKGLTSGAVGVFIVIAFYLVFYVLMLIAVVAVSRSILIPQQDGNWQKIGALVAMCVGSLGLAYGTAFAFSISRLSIP